MNYIEHFVLPVGSFWHCRREHSGTRKSMDSVVYDIGWFYPGKSAEIRSSSCDSSSSSTSVVVIASIRDVVRFFFLRLIIVPLLLGGSKPCSSGKTAVSILLDLISCR